MAQTKTRSMSKGGLLTAKQLADVSVPLGLVLAKRSIENFSKRTTITSAKKGGALSAQQIADISVPLGIVLAKKGAEKLMKAPAKKGGSSCGSHTKKNKK